MQFESIQPGVLRATAQATRDEVLTGLATDSRFAVSLSNAIAAVPFAGVYFETPPLTEETLQQPFECVLVDGGKALAGLLADPAPFRSQLATSDTIVTFANLGGDAVLVAPTPAPGVDCAHLAAFLRTADDDRRAAFWRAAAMALRAALGQGPRWLSTAGLGVSWLHLRIDSRPKYYRYRPYR
jgi:hypothetical protein